MTEADLTTKENALKGFPDFINRLTDLLIRLTPPTGFIDPVIKIEMNVLYIRHAIDVLEELIEPLRQFLLLTTLNYDCYNMENSKNPLIYTIYAIRSSLLKELESMKPAEQSYYRPTFSLVILFLGDITILVWEALCGATRIYHFDKKLDPTIDAKLWIFG